MARSTAAKVLMAASLLAMLLAAPLIDSAGAAPAQSCNGYTATTLTVSPASVAAGGSITLAGLGVPGETVTATLLSTPNAPLGSGVVSGGGTFSFGATVPLTTAAGTYTVRGTSTSCSSFVVSLTVTAPPPLVLAATTTTVAPTTTTTVAPTTTAGPTTTTPSTVVSSCSASAAGRTFIPGQQVLWTYNTVGYDTAKQVRLRLRNASGTAYVLRNTAAWPAGNQATVTIPVGATAGSWVMEQSGFSTTGSAKSSTCSVTVAAAPAPAASGTSTGSPMPIAAIAIAAVTLAGLIQLRFRRLRRTAV
jgi:hypothetical protein